jgi:hypothetical protein
MIRRLIDRLVRRGIREGLSRGVLDGNQVWVIVGGLALLAHLAGRVLHREPEVVFRELLEPGEAISIFHEPRP